jgi:GGDEF domain-containing protein
MPGVRNGGDAEAMAARLRQEIEQPFLIDGGEVLIGASVGLHVGAPAEEPDEVLRAADHAMYAVKKTGGGRRNRAAPAHPVEVGPAHPVGVGPADPVEVGRHRAEA